MNPEIPVKPWSKNRHPRAVLAIRLQAMGDLVITLPYLQQLRDSLPPGTRLDLLTRKEVDPIPRSIQLFDKVYSIGGGRNTKMQLLWTGYILPLLWLNRYEVVIDLQHNIVSQFARKFLLPAAWSEFDRFSPIPAGESTRLTIEALGLSRQSLENPKLADQMSGNHAPVGSLPGEHTPGNHQLPDQISSPLFPVHPLRIKDNRPALAILENAGWDKQKELVILNPAGAFRTRNWSLANYVQFAMLWLKDSPKTQFLVLGLQSIAEKAGRLADTLSTDLIDLTGKTTVSQAFAILGQATLILTEDSGLMHMAWVSAVPTLALFGSTRSDRATPLGSHTCLLDSSDMACGNCMLRECPYGEPRCLTRRTPGEVYQQARALLGRNITAARAMPVEPV